VIQTQMAFVVGVIFALAGLAFGSFLNVVIYRVPRKQSIVRPRSACRECGATIRGRDNIPLLSYVLLRGRCRDCRAPVSAEYPIVEAVTGALFVAASVAFADLWLAVLVAPFLGVMVTCSAIDLHHRIIPNRIIVPSLVVFGAAVSGLALAGQPLSPATGALGLLGYGGGLFVVTLISPSGMGMGDVKLAAVIGLVLGALGWVYVGVAAMVAVLSGGVGAVVTLLRGGTGKDAIPFGPYLAGGAVVSALVGPGLADWYTRLLS
jgi:leader peptidase (prepilin peptidase)/N-methyltransferase